MCQHNILDYINYFGLKCGQCGTYCCQEVSDEDQRCLFRFPICSIVFILLTVGIGMAPYMPIILRVTLFPQDPVMCTRFATSYSVESGVDFGFVILLYAFVIFLEMQLIYLPVALYELDRKSDRSKTLNEAVTYFGLKLLIFDRGIVTLCSIGIIFLTDYCVEDGAAMVGIIGVALSFGLCIFCGAIACVMRSTNIFEPLGALGYCLAGHVMNDGYRMLFRYLIGYICLPFIYLLFVITQYGLTIFVAIPKRLMIFWLLLIIPVYIIDMMYLIWTVTHFLMEADKLTGSRKLKFRHIYLRITNIILSNAIQGTLYFLDSKIDSIITILIPIMLSFVITSIIATRYMAIKCSRYINDDLDDFKKRGDI